MNDLDVTIDREMIHTAIQDSCVADPAQEVFLVGHLTVHL
jgi:hypothetical protein